MDFNTIELMSRATADGELRIAARYLTATVVVAVDGDEIGFVFVDGRLVRVSGEDIPSSGPVLRLSGGRDDWERVLSVVPPAFFHDVLFGALFQRNGITVTGSELELLYPYYRAVQRLVGLLREATSGASPVALTAPPVTRRMDAAVGRYVYLTIDAVQYRVYFEEAGEGVPVVLQHTAGADGRQYRHLLESEDLRSKYRMLAYDLPFHGKSNPPAGERWWAEEYTLSEDFLVKFVVEFCRVLELDRPVFLGCSIGGSLAPDLAYHRPHEFRHVIAINASVRGGGAEKDEVMDRSWQDPRINGEWIGQWMYGHTSPTAPEVYRRENGWYYSQGAPGVLHGDLFYYQVDHDLRGKLQEIDTSICGVDVIVGEYDPAILSDTMGSRGLADGIEGSTFTVAEGLAHFMMSEDPDRFIAMITPVLERAAHGAPAAVSASSTAGGLA